MRDGPQRCCVYYPPTPPRHSLLLVGRGEKHHMVLRLVFPSPH
jgi:hypothetical protein